MSTLATTAQGKFLFYSFEMVTYLFGCLINWLGFVCVCVLVVVVVLLLFYLDLVYRACGRFDVALKNGCSATHRRTSYTKTKLAV